ncbi:MAG TPA: hypothetical protein VHA15_01495 [Burkholderiales bacterium]|jgi:hypothetical protein|nr:hypothetical protein [Burkholderiales bacterium]
MDKKNRLLAPLVAAAAASVVAFAGIGVAAITGHLSVTQLNPNPLAGLLGGAKAAPAASAATPKSGKAATRSANGPRPIDFRPGTRVAGSRAKCPDCGVVDSIRAKEVERADVAAAGFGGSEATSLGRASGINYAALRSTDARTAVNFVVTLRMEDGTTRTIHENQRPPFSIGERVRLVNGSVVPLG